MWFFLPIARIYEVIRTAKPAGKIKIFALRFQPINRNIHFGKREQFLSQIFQGGTNVVNGIVNNEESVMEARAFNN